MRYSRWYNSRKAKLIVAIFFIVFLVPATLAIIDFYSGKHFTRGIVESITAALIEVMCVLYIRYLYLRDEFLEGGAGPGADIFASRSYLKRGYRYEAAVKKQVQMVYPKSVKDLNLGYINYLVKALMKKGITETVTAQVFFNKDLLGDREQQSFTELIYITKLVTARLIPDDKFEVRNLSSETQIVLDNDKTVWNWDIKPVKSGVGLLQLVVSAHIENEGKGFEIKDIETLRREIKIQVNHAYTIKTFLKTNWQWLIGLLCGSGVIVVILKGLGVIK